MLHMLDLNDDCLIHICQFLNLTQQLTVKDVCLRLNDIIMTLWRHCKTITLSYELLNKFKTAPTDFVQLLSSAKDTLEELHMDRVDAHQLRLLQHLTFHRVYYLDCNLSHTGDKTNDQDVLLLIKLFPALTKLTLLSSITGKHLCSMRELVDLDLSCCELLKTKFLAKIFKSLKLKKFSLLYYGYNTLLNDRITAITECDTLEELKIDDHHLLLFIDGLLKMPHMRKIDVYTRDYDVYLLNKIANAHGPRVHTMMYNSVFWSRDEHVNVLKKMPNLQRLVMIEDDIDDDQMCEIATNLRHLVELHFIAGRLGGEDCLVEIIKHCEHLKILNISHTSVSVGLLDKLIDAVNTSTRRQPLKLFCTGTAFMDIDLQKLDVPKQLHISKKACVIETPYTRFFQCEWLPEV